MFDVVAVHHVREYVVWVKSSCVERLFGVSELSRLTYVEVLTSERKRTTIGFLRRAVRWFAKHGILIRQMLWEHRESRRLRFPRFP